MGLLERGWTTWFVRGLPRSFGRASTRLLCRAVATGKAGQGSFAAVRELANNAPTSWHTERALRTLALWDERDTGFRSMVLFGLKTAPRYRERVDISQQVTEFLVARVADYLRGPDANPPCAPGISHRDIATWVVNTARNAADREVRERLCELLSTTDEEHLVAAVSYAFEMSVRGELGQICRHPSGLWENGRFTRFGQVVVANPNLPPSALIAVLQDRRISLSTERPARAVDDLIELITSSLAPVEIKDRSRRALRELPPGPAREYVCKQAILGHEEEAVTAAADAGYRPADEKHELAFLFATGQWDHYDRMDPDGSRLRAYCRKHAKGYWDTYRRPIEASARRHDRPNPCPKLPKVTTTTRAKRWRHTGSLPTSPGDYGGFGSF